MAIKTLSINSFSGGRNTKLSDNMIAANETGAQSWTCAENAALSKMRGYTTVSTKVSANNLLFIVKMIQTNLGASGATRLVMLTKNYVGDVYTSRLSYTDNGTNFYYAEVTGTNFSGVAVPFMGMFKGKLYVSDGTNAVVSYDGTTVAAVAAFPKYSKCAVHKNYMFAAKDSTIYWSDLNDAATWPANNFQTIDAEEGDFVVAMKSWGGNLVIFKKRSMYLLVGDVFDPIEGNYYLQKIDVPAGFTFLYSDCVCVHNGMMKFLTPDGFYSYSGGSTITKISDIIQTDTDLITSPTSLFYTTQTESPERTPRSWVWKNRMYVNWLVGTARKTLVCDENNKWWLSSEIDYTDPPTNSSTRTMPITAVQCNLGSGEKLYGGTAAFPVLMTLDSGYSQVNASEEFSIPTKAITASWSSKTFMFPSECVFHYAEVHLKKQSSGTLTFSVSTDGGTDVSKSVPMSTGTGAILKKRVPIQKIGRSIKFSVSNAEAGVNFEIYGITLVYEPTGATRA